MVGTQMRRRRGTAALQRRDDAGRPSRRSGPSWCRICVSPPGVGSYRPSTCYVTDRSDHCGPSAVSVTSMPACLSRSRISSASAQLRCSRAFSPAAPVRPAPARRRQPARPTFRHAIPSVRRAGRSPGCPSSRGLSRRSSGHLHDRRRRAPGCPRRGRGAPRPARSGPPDRRRAPRRTAGSIRPGTTAPTRLRTRCRKSSTPT